MCLCVYLGDSTYILQTNLNIYADGYTEKTASVHHYALGGSYVAVFDQMKTTTQDTPSAQAEQSNQSLNTKKTQIPRQARVTVETTQPCGMASGDKDRNLRHLCDAHTSLQHQFAAHISKPLTYIITDADLCKHTRKQISLTYKRTISYSCVDSATILLPNANNIQQGHFLEQQRRTMASLSRLRFTRYFQLVQTQVAPYELLTFFKL